MELDILECMLCGHQVSTYEERAQHAERHHDLITALNMSEKLVYEKVDEVQEMLREFIEKQRHILQYGAKSFVSQAVVSRR